MPYFSFDLVIGEVFKNQGVMILEDTEIAIDKADSLAEEICVARPQLCSKGYAVRVTDRDGSELYRTPVDQIPPWLSQKRTHDPECMVCVYTKSSLIRQTW